MKATKTAFKVCISGSKSESNRALILQSFCPEVTIQNLSDSDDTDYLKSALENLNSGATTLECGHAGTVWRFLLARLVFEPNFSGKLTGSQRLLSRPVLPLIHALTPFAKAINIQKDHVFISSQSGFGPSATFTIDATQSSQFISALCLCAPRFPNGININLVGNISSVPYIQMTLDFLRQLGNEYTFTDKKIEIKPGAHNNKHFTVEPDWSSLSYWFSAAVISETTIILPHFLEKSLQADAKILEFAHHFGVQYTFSPAGLELAPLTSPRRTKFEADFEDCPDIAPTFMALCAGLNIPCHLTGLHSLQHKECDRIMVMHNNLKLLGYTSQITHNSFAITSFTKPDYSKKIEVSTDLDHRIAMSMAPLQLLFKNITFDDTDVVSKSYKNFWKDMNDFHAHLTRK